MGLEVAPVALGEAFCQDEDAADALLQIEHNVVRDRHPDLEISLVDTKLEWVVGVPTFRFKVAQQLSRDPGLIGWAVGHESVEAKLPAFDGTGLTLETIFCQLVSQAPLFGPVKVEAEADDEDEQGDDDCKSKVMMIGNDDFAVVWI